MYRIDGIYSNNLSFLIIGQHVGIETYDSGIFDLLGYTYRTNAFMCINRFGSIVYVNDNAAVRK